MAHFLRQSYFSKGGSISRISLQIKRNHKKRQNLHFEQILSLNFLTDSMKTNHSTHLAVRKLTKRSNIELGHIHIMLPEILPLPPPCHHFGKMSTFIKSA